MLKQTYSQKLTQKLLPKIILNQNILAIPTLALDNIVKRELELNPMLEEESEFEQSEQEPAINEEKDLNSEINSSAANEEQTAQIIEPLQETNEEIKESSISEEYDWDEYFENEANENRHYENNNNAEYDNSYIRDNNTSSKDSFVLQLHLSDLNEKLIFIGEEILWSLTEEGYFNETPEDILQDLEVKKIGTKFENETFQQDELETALEYLQNNLDPPGVAARNLKECLLIQIRRSGKSDDIKSLSSKIVTDHFEDLKLKRYERISKELEIDLQKVKEIFEFIQKLNPKPGSSEESSAENYIVPDLIVKKIDDKYEIFLNERFTPSLRISKSYRNLYTDKKKSLDKDTKQYILNNFNRAKWFIDAINSRRETLIKIMEAIIKRQRVFFDNNETGLRPLFEKEVADDIKMDTSTISRAVRGKFVQTDFGIHELRSFFTTSLATNDGGDVSNTEAKVVLKDLIDNEDKTKPLTDEELAAEMKSRGLRIARRTVAKYREAINVPIAKLRREIQ